MSFWKTLAKLALTGAGVGFAPMTGGLSMVGAGAAAGAIDGGVKGAVTGGAMGAIPLGVGKLGGAIIGSGAKTATQLDHLVPEALRAGTTTAATGAANPQMWRDIGSILGKVATSRATNRPSIAELSRANMLASGEGLFDTGS